MYVPNTGKNNIIKQENQLIQNLPLNYYYFFKKKKTI